jgi:hypothetical protein
MKKIRVFCFFVTAFFFVCPSITMELQTEKAGTLKADIKMGIELELQGVDYVNTSEVLLVDGRHLNVSIDDTEFVSVFGGDFWSNFPRLSPPFYAPNFQI